VHGRGDHHRPGEGQGDVGQQVVGQAGGHAGQGVGGRRGDHQDLAPAGQGDVLDGGRVVPDRGRDPPAGEGGEGGPAHHLLAGGGEQRLHLGPGPLQLPGQLGRLVGGDPAAHPEQHPGPSQRLIRPGR
jgi:hypothetical protein